MYHIFLFNLFIPIINIDIIIALNDVNEYIHIYNNEIEIKVLSYDSACFLSYLIISRYCSFHHLLNYLLHTSVFVMIINSSYS
jgi:hypothetical protein